MRRDLAILDEMIDAAEQAHAIAIDADPATLSRDRMRRTGVRPSDVKGGNRAHGNRDPGDAGGGVPVARGLPVRGDLHP